MHVLGQEAVESQEEDPATAGDACRRSDRNQFHRDRRDTGHHHWPAGLGRQKGSRLLLLFAVGQTEPSLVAFYDIRSGNGAGLFFQPCSCSIVADTHLYPHKLNMLTYITVAQCRRQG